MRYPSGKRPASVFCTIVLVLLCVCVIVQMLGVPATLLDPAAASDTLGHSLLEGFSVPPAAMELRPSIKTEQAHDIQQVVLRPVLSSVPFHPPLASLVG
jgi:hypothetical protein